MSAGLARLLSWMGLLRQASAVAALAVAVFAAGVALTLALLSARARRRADDPGAGAPGRGTGGHPPRGQPHRGRGGASGRDRGVGTLLVVFPRVLRGIEGAVGLGPLAVAPSLGAREIALALMVALALGWMGGWVATPRERAR
jgi:hypothetical protein